MQGLGVASNRRIKELRRVVLGQLKRNFVKEESALQKAMLAAQRDSRDLNINENFKEGHIKTSSWEWVKEYVTYMRKNNGFGKFEKKRPKGSRPSSDFKKDEEENSNVGEKSGEDKKASDGKQEEKTSKDSEKNLTPEEQAKQFKEKIEQEFERLLNPKKDDQGEEKTSKKAKSNSQKKGLNKNTFNFTTGGGNQGPENDPRKADLLKNLRNLGIGMLVFFLLTSGSSENQYEDISFDFFENEYLRKGQVKNLTIVRTLVKGHSQTVIIFSPANASGSFRCKIPNVDHFLQKLEELQVSKGIPEKDWIKVNFSHELTRAKAEWNGDKIKSAATGLIITGVIFYLMRQSSRAIGRELKKAKNQFKGNNKELKTEGLIVDAKDIEIGFDDVAGMEEAKREIKEFVEFMKNAEKYSKLGAVIPRGALLTGPPGTGKTLLAKACAKEAGVPYFYMSGSEFVEQYVGVGASRVRKLFEVAKKKAPCIIFIDEIDAIGRKRDSGGMGGNPERENTLNQLLVELDGFNTNEEVVLFGATNMPDSLDPALLRPGRFDRSIQITLPDLDARQKIFQVHLKKIKLNEEKTLEGYAKRLATLTSGFSGAEIANICNEAAIIAARVKAEHVSSHDFEMAVERVIAGIEKKSPSSQDLDTKRTVAIHESGHGVVSWFLEGGLPLLKLTVIPRSKGSLGFAQYLPNETGLERKTELVDRLCCILGGRVAEEILIGKVRFSELQSNIFQITTGASDDLQKIHDLAHEIVTKFGMNSTNRPFWYQEDSQGNKSYSNKTNELIDSEKEKLIKHCTEKTRLLISQHKEKILE